MKYIKINPEENVAVALTDLLKGEVVEGVTLQTDVPRGHKVVLKDLKSGDNVITRIILYRLSPGYSSDFSIR